MNRLCLAIPVFAAFVAAAGSPAAAGPPAAAPRVAQPAAGARLAAGSSAVALFDLTGVPLDGVDEMELVLSFDGGLTYPEAVSRGLSPGASRAVWTTPDVAASRAVLGVRTGGRGEAERVVAVSAPFDIVAPVSEAPPPAGGALTPRESAVGSLFDPDDADFERIPVPSPLGDEPLEAPKPPAVGAGPEPPSPVSSGPVFLPRRE